jgi:hypothetical protein
MISAVAMVPPKRLKEGLRTLLVTRDYEYLKVASLQEFPSELSTDDFLLEILFN